MQTVIDTGEFITTTAVTLGGISVQPSVWKASILNRTQIQSCVDEMNPKDRMLRELPADPVVHLILRFDGIEASVVRALLQQIHAKQGLE